MELALIGALVTVSIGFVGVVLHSDDSAGVLLVSGIDRHPCLRRERRAAVSNDAPHVALSVRAGAAFFAGLAVGPQVSSTWGMALWFASGVVLVLNVLWMRSRRQ